MTYKNSKISSRQIFLIGLMVFSLFFGAGNLIFPAIIVDVIAKGLSFTLIRVKDN